MSLHFVSRASAVEPVSVSELKQHLRISDVSEDGYLRRLTSVIRSRCERATRRALLTQTWDLYLDQWPTWSGYHGSQTFEPVTTPLPAGGWVEFPKAPLQSVTFVKYTALDGTLTTWDAANYSVDAPTGDYARRGRLSLGWVKVWPVTQPVANAIQIRIVCGYGDKPQDVPAMLVQGMLLDAGTLFETRGAVLAGARAAAIEIPSTSFEMYRSFRSL
jgi:uncharacterized phiE125 gp8 family phage protein